MTVGAALPIIFTRPADRKALEKLLKLLWAGTADSKEFARMDQRTV